MCSFGGRSPQGCDPFAAATQANQSSAADKICRGILSELGLKVVDESGFVGWMMVCGMWTVSRAINGPIPGAAPPSSSLRAQEVERQSQGGRPPCVTMSVVALRTWNSVRGWPDANGPMWSVGSARMGAGVQCASGECTWGELRG